MAEFDRTVEETNCLPKDKNLLTDQHSHHDQKKPKRMSVQMEDATDTAGV